MGLVISVIEGDGLLPANLKKEIPGEIGDTGLLNPSMESTRVSWSAELVLELEREVVGLEVESGIEKRPLLSESRRASETCSGGSII